MFILQIIILKGILLMKTIEEILQEEIIKLEKIVGQARKRIHVAPKGFLRIAKKGKWTEYYYKEAGSGGGNGKYIRKEDIAVAKNIAQRDYDYQLVKLAEKRVCIINEFIDKYKNTNISDQFNQITPKRRELIDNIVLSDEEYIKRWQETEFIGKPFEDADSEIITERGERVRSKSEKIIADKLNSLNLAYRYECPLVFGNITLYPDFTILKMPERRVVYLEHLGLMDDGKYVGNAVQKMRIYEKNEIYLGVNLFITYETLKSPINIRGLDGMLRTLFC